MSQPTENETLVIQTEPDTELTRLEKVITSFGEAPIKPKQSPPASNLVSAWEGIYMGEPIDRLSPELRKDYAKLTRSKRGILFELEIVSYENGSKKQLQDLENEVIRLGQTLGGAGQIYECDYGECGVRVCLWCTGQKFKELVESAEWQHSICFFEARPKFETYQTATANFNVSELGSFISPPANAPIVCVIDTGVAPGNPFLTPVVRTDLCRSYLPGAADKPWDENGHGSGVASLAAYFALSIQKGYSHEAKAWIASARILDADGYMDKGTGDIESDRVAEARLLSSTLKEIVADYKPAGVRVFVLAFTVKNRRWNKEGFRLVPRASWLARTLDQLSKDEGVVFVTITGNALNAEIVPLHQSNAYPKYLSLEEMKIEDPAQSALAITVGSVAHSATVGANMVPIAKVGQPSPFTRSGPGLGFAVKPDVVERGGNCAFDSVLKRIPKNLQTEILMASHRLSPSIAHNSGTSFAAPRVAHHLAIIQNDLRQLGTIPSASLLRALLINCSTHAALDKDFFPAKHRNWIYTVGHGRPSGQAALECDEHTPLLIYDGAILPDKVALFSIPLPPEIAGPDEKMFRVTVAYSPQVQQYGLQAYLSTTLKFRLFTGDKDPNAIAAALSLDDGEENEVADQEDDFAGALVGVQLRSKGTVQHDVFRAKNFPANWTAHPFVLALALTPKWGGYTTPVEVAVVVRIEDRKRAVAQLHTKLKARITAAARVRARG